MHIYLSSQLKQFSFIFFHCTFDVKSGRRFHSLRPVDVEFMKALHEKVNIIPLIAKADCLTPNEIKKLKDRVSPRPAAQQHRDSRLFPIIRILILCSLMCEHPDTRRNRQVWHQSLPVPRM